VRVEAIVTLANWERRNLEDIEQELTAANPRLARLLRAPGAWCRLRWGPRRGRVGALFLGLLTAVCVLIIVLAAR
jgi:Protein of unknown function (DUF3040)